ncbi:hypothetical protein BS47DRAFT_1342664 [Hydnum rufescens UP504]|uniref:Uncharacterized protein n=1 Tax=Hydnum rufescens UP504 TaxID=1448309 RepID=A0A9P6AZT1_9AGAM|nr:hypothetical protein BS47DRAFT_1342664 [Hydnum rufescens UP504]
MYFRRIKAKPVDSHIVLYRFPFPQPLFSSQHPNTFFMPPKPTPPQKRKDRNPTTNPVEDEHDGAGPSNDLDTSKRVPGRPRGSKTASDAAVNSGPPATDGEPALKRPRGRPKKVCHNHVLSHTHTHPLLPPPPFLPPRS